MQKLGVILLFICGTAAAGCEDMVAGGKPEVSANIAPTYLCRRMYVLEHSAERKTAYWSAEHLVGEQQKGTGKRINAFKADPDLPKDERATPSDYLKSGWDQGHLAPVADMYSDPKAMLESFYLSNMVPQLPSNNRIGWKGLERYTRLMAVKRGDIFVVTGPIYVDAVKTIGSSKVAIPSHMYKILYDSKTNEALSFVVPNVPVKVLDLHKFVSDVATVEQLTKVNFFPQLNVKDSHMMW